MPDSDMQIFKSGASSSKLPRLDLLSQDFLHRVARRCEMGLENHKERAWSPFQNEGFLTDQEWVIARAAHVIDHAFNIIRKIRRGEPLPGSDDDAGAIGWGGMLLCEATRALEAERMRSAAKEVSADKAASVTIRTEPAKPSEWGAEEARRRGYADGFVGLTDWILAGREGMGQEQQQAYGRAWDTGLQDRLLKKRGFPMRPWGEGKRIDGSPMPPRCTVCEWPTGTNTECALCVATSHGYGMFRVYPETKAAEPAPEASPASPEPVAQPLAEHPLLDLGVSCEQWNARCPVGTKLLFPKGAPEGSRTEYATVCAAYVLRGTPAVRAMYIRGPHEVWQDGQVSRRPFEVLLAGIEKSYDIEPVAQEAQEVQYDGF